jgi:peptidoglycan/LPS O-acetylase OafA/YrhL
MSDSSATISQRRDVPGLSGARALAAIAVIGTHAGFVSGQSLQHHPFSALLARLDFGVTLFFLLSGFLLSRQFLAEPERLQWRGLRAFWRRRFLRILPAYWLAIAVVLLWLSPTRPHAGDWWSYLLLIQTYNGHNLNPDLTQMWTLGVELSFYLLLPMLLIAARWFPVPRPWRVAGLLVAMIAAALGSELYIHIAVSGETQTLLWLPNYLDWFALGIGLAALTVEGVLPTSWYRAPRRWATSPGTCWALGLILLWFATTPIGGPRDLTPATTWEWTSRHLLYGGSAFFLLLPLVAGAEPWTDALLGNRFMRWLGDCSYGIYLWQTAIVLHLQSVLGWRAFTGHFVPLFLGSVLVATAAGAVSWHLVERPLLRRFSASWRSRSTLAGVPRPRASGVARLRAGRSAVRV